MAYSVVTILALALIAICLANLKYHFIREIGTLGSQIGIGIGSGIILLQMILLCKNRNAPVPISEIKGERLDLETTKGIMTSDGFYIFTEKQRDDAVGALLEDQYLPSVVKGKKEIWFAGTLQDGMVKKYIALYNKCKCKNGEPPVTKGGNPLPLQIINVVLDHKDEGNNSLDDASAVTLSELCRPGEFFEYQKDNITKFGIGGGALSNSRPLSRKRVPLAHLKLRNINNFTKKAENQPKSN